jgi:hypothetical protein
MCPKQVTDQHTCRRPECPTPGKLLMLRRHTELLFARLTPELTRAAKRHRVE